MSKPVQPPIEVAELYSKIQQLANNMTNSPEPFWNCDLNEPNQNALFELEVEIRQILVQIHSIPGYTNAARTLAFGRATLKLIEGLLLREANRVRGKRIHSPEIDHFINVIASQEVYK